MSGLTREVVTLQVGHYSNFVGTHWWNIQEAGFAYGSDGKVPHEINPDILFREGQTLQGEVTYTPRVVMLDLKGSMSTLKQDGILYDVPEVRDDLQWMGDVTLHKQDPEPKNDFLQDLEEEMAVHTEDLDEDKERDKSKDLRQSGVGAEMKKIYQLDNHVQVWSDYLGTHLHPKTVHIINDFTHNSDTEGFEVFGQGVRVEREQRDAIEDRLHFFMEECDSLQGIQLLCDSHDGFGGVTASLLETLSDEFSTKGLLAIPVHPCMFSETKSGVNVSRQRALNIALCYERLLAEAPSILPLSLSTNPLRPDSAPLHFPHLTYKPELAYHTSAVLAAGLENATLSYRVCDQPSQLSHLTGALTTHGRKVMSLQAALPFPMATNASLTDTLLHCGATLPWQPLSPMSSPQQPVIGQSVVLRGFPTSKLRGPMREDIPRSLQQCDSIEQLLDIYLQETCNTNRNAINHVQGPCHLSTSFPHIFTPQVNQHGAASVTQRPIYTGVDDIPVLTSLQCSDQSIHLIKELHRLTSRIKIKQFHRFIEEGLEEDTWNEVQENLMRHIKCYTEEENG